MEYLIWLVYFVGIPNALLWLWQHRYFTRYWPVFGKVTVAALIVAFVWDKLAIQIYGIWSFPRHTGLGWSLFGIPIEQYLFYIFVAWIATELTLTLRHYGQ